MRLTGFDVGWGVGDPAEVFSLAEKQAKAVHFRILLNVSCL